VSGANAAPARSIVVLRLALGFVFLYFGLLKLFPDLSPAEMIATQTIMRLSLQWLDAHTALRLLALLEIAIGLGFLLNLAPRWLLVPFLVHMVGTAVPLFVMPEYCFKIAPFAPSLEGQYIIKNLVLAAAGWVVLAPGLTAAAPGFVPVLRVEGEGSI
jgi:uncharacterized membrane protein YphA (DoxX/SURF4 family)